MTPAIGGSLAQKAVLAREEANRKCRHNGALLPALSRHRWDTRSQARAWTGPRQRRERWRAKFHASFAADVDAETATFMADSQVPWGLGALSGAISEPAWRSKPSWYLVVTEDQMIPVAAQRAMAKRAGATIVETKGSHAIYVSQPAPVAALIERAAKGGA
jgi:pimeloyl-ACP methyl ester carboxylesterase